MWVDHGSISLATTLLHSGYDVWLGNNRGNIYSRFHQELDPDVDKAKFFDFSFYEFAKYDLPAIIGGILNRTET